MSAFTTPNPHMIIKKPSRSHASVTPSNCWCRATKILQFRISQVWGLSCGQGPHVGLPGFRSQARAKHAEYQLGLPPQNRPYVSLCIVSLFEKHQVSTHLQYKMRRSQSTTTPKQRHRATRAWQLRRSCLENGHRAGRNWSFSVQT